MNRHVLELIALGAVWGFSFIFLRIAVPAIGAAPVTFVRLSLAVLLLGGVVWWLKKSVPWREKWRQFAFFGVLNTGAPFLMFAFAAQHLPAGYLAILNGTASLFSALVAAFWLKQKLAAHKVAGVVIGLIGVVVLVGLAPVALTRETMWAIAAGLLASLCYATAGNTMSKAFPGISSYSIAFATLVPAALFLLPLAASVAPAAQQFTPKVIYALLFLGFVTTGVAYLLYFRLLAAIGAVRTSTVGFLIPVFALLWGAIFLGEPITTANIVGGGLVLLGVAFAQGLFERKSGSSD